MKYDMNQIIGLIIHARHFCSRRSFVVVLRSIIQSEGKINHNCTPNPNHWECITSIYGSSWNLFSFQVAYINDHIAWVWTHMDFLSGFSHFLHQRMPMSKSNLYVTVFDNYWSLSLLNIYPIIRYI